MYSKIMVPVDLAHAQGLEKALATAADLAKHYAIPVCYVGISAATPGAVAHNPEEFAAKLDAFAQAQAEARGLAQVSAAPYVTHDPTIDLDPTLLRAVKEQGCDLVVMQSHVPGIAEYLFASNAGHVATHSDVTVMVVR